MSEIPWITTDVLGRGTEHGTLDRHPAVCRVVVAGGKESFDRQAEENDPPVSVVEVPARYLVAVLEARHRSDLESNLLQFGPGSAQELDGGADGQVESIQPAVQRSQGRAHDLAATQATVSTVSSAAPWCGCGANGATAGHD